MGNNRSSRKHILRFTTKSTLLFILLVSFAHASDHSLEGPSDWPMYQLNPQHTGYNDKDQITVPLQLLWKKKCLPLPHDLEPITAVGDRIIFTNDRSSNDTIKTTISCLSANDGSELWKQEHEGSFIHSLDQACYDKGFLYVLEAGYKYGYENDNVKIATYDLESGTIIKWLYFASQSYDQLGSIVYDDKLLFPAGYYNGIICVEPVTDSLIWWTKLVQEDNWSPAACDSTIYTWIRNILMAHDLATGEVMWHIQPKYSDTAKILNPSSGSFDESDLNLQSNDTDKDVITEDATEFDPGMHTAPAIDTLHKMIYLYNHDGFFAVNYETKRRIWFKEFDYDNFKVIVTPSVCDGRVYSIFLEYLIAYDGLTGDELCRYELDTLSRYSTAIANGNIFASTRNKTVAIDLDTYEKVWEYPAGGYITIANGRLFLASHTGEIYAFGNVVTAVEDDNKEKLPKEFALHQNYPNPFNPTTTINFVIPKRSEVVLRVFNLLGKEVTTLIDKSLPAGSHSVLWNGKDGSGEPAASGVYLYSLVTNQISIVKKMILIK